MKPKKIIALIMARKGSKSIPYKNIKLLHGYPLIAWTIAAGKLSKKIASYIKGRYILIKLIGSGNSNVDAKYVGVEGYRMYDTNKNEITENKGNEYIKYKENDESKEEKKEEKKMFVPSSDNEGPKKNQILMEIKWK